MHRPKTTLADATAASAVCALTYVRKQDLQLLQLNQTCRLQQGGIIALVGFAKPLEHPKTWVTTRLIPPTCGAV